MDELALQQLSELLVRGEVAILLGPDLPEAMTGVLGWSELAVHLSRRGGFPDSNDWPTVAARYVQTFGRRNLVDWLAGQVNGKAQGPLYSELAALPIQWYIAATYDDLLQSALRAAARPPNVVIGEDDLNFIRPERPVVVKLLGEISAGRLDSLLLTTSDIHSLIQYRSRILAQAVHPIFARMSLLILGQDVSAEVFRSLYYWDLPQTRAFRRQSFAIWQRMEAWEKDAWAADKLTIIEGDPLELVRQLLTHEPPG